MVKIEGELPYFDFAILFEYFGLICTNISSAEFNWSFTSQIPKGNDHGIKGSAKDLQNHISFQKYWYVSED